jgi:hypothetical protein
MSIDIFDFARKVAASTEPSTETLVTRLKTWSHYEECIVNGITKITENNTGVIGGQYVFCVSDRDLSYVPRLKGIGVVGRPGVWIIESGTHDVYKGLWNSGASYYDTGHIVLFGGNYFECQEYMNNPTYPVGIGYSIEDADLYMGDWDINTTYNKYEIVRLFSPGDPYDPYSEDSYYYVYSLIDGNIGDDPEGENSENWGYIEYPDTKWNPAPGPGFAGCAVVMGNNASAGGYDNTSLVFIPQTGEYHFETDVMVPQLAVTEVGSEEDYLAKIGLMNRYKTIESYVTGLYFSYGNLTAGGSINWIANSVIGGEGTIVDTNIPVVANQWYRLRIIVSADGLTETFYIDDVLVATITTNIPNVPIGPILSITKTRGQSPEFLWVDWIWNTYTLNDTVRPESYIPPPEP